MYLQQSYLHYLLNNLSQFSPVESKSCKKPKIMYNSKLTVSLNMHITIKWHAGSIVVHALWQHFIILHWVDHICFGIFVFFVVEQFIQQHMTIAAIASSSLVIHNFLSSFINLYYIFFFSMKLFLSYANITQRSLQYKSIQFCSFHWLMAVHFSVCRIIFVICVNLLVL